jgi:16S rRNA (guanine527-N7)-methyltransferase
MPAGLPKLRWDPEFHVKREPAPGPPGFHVKHGSDNSYHLAPDQAAQLADFESLLRDKAIPLGLISQGDERDLHERHILDSLRAAALFRPNDTRALDLGSGAGLPGIVLAIALPRCRFVLAERRRRRAGFLELAVDRLELPNAEVAVARAEELTGEWDVATARAFAPPARAWRIAHRLLRPGGRLIYFAGSREPAEGIAEDLNPQPVDIEVKGLANFPPLVIMTRG